MPSPAPGRYELAAGKRGSGLKWRAPDGCAKRYADLIAHTMGDGEIYWRGATEAEEESVGAGKNAIAANDIATLLSAIPRMETREKKVVIGMCKTRGISRDRASNLVAQLIQEGKIVETKVPRPAARRRGSSGPCSRARPAVTETGERVVSDSTRSTVTLSRG